MNIQDHWTGWRPPRSVLVLHDFSAEAAHAAWRGGMIARDQGADLRIIHAAVDASSAEAARTRLHKLADDLSSMLGIDAQVTVMHGRTADDIVRAGRMADLVVIGAGRRNILREWIAGTQAERLIRLCGRPVLVVKSAPHAGYRRVLVPVDFSPVSAIAVGVAAGLSRCLAIEVFHSLATRDEITLRAADVPEVEMRNFRRRNADRARASIQELIGSVPAAALSAVPSIGFGDAASMVLTKERAMRADLVVVGKRHRGLLADFFLGSVTQRILASARADVLVLPMPKPAAHALGTLRRSGA